MMVCLVAHSLVLVTSLSRVILIHYEWCLDMPNLTDVYLSDPFDYKNHVTIRGSTHFIPLSRIDIGALRRFFKWSPRGTWLLSLCHTHPQHPLPSTSELIQRHLRERYRCANTEIMTIRIWNDGNPIRIVETTSNYHSLHIAWNPHHSSFQITHITSPLQWEPKLNNWKWQPKHQSSHRTAYLAILNPIITSTYQFHPSIPISETTQSQSLSHRIHTKHPNPTMNIPILNPISKSLSSTHNNHTP